MKKSELRKIIKEEMKIKKGGGHYTPPTDLEKSNDPAIKAINDYGWEIAVLMNEMKFIGPKVEDWVEYNKGRSLGPAVPIFTNLIFSLKQLKKMIE